MIKTSADSCHDRHISPHSVIATCIFGLLLGPVCTFSIFRSTSKLSPMTRPNTTCLQAESSGDELLDIP